MPPAFLKGIKMTYRQKTLDERQLVDVADLTDSTSGTTDGTVGPVADIALSTSDSYTDAAVNSAVNAAIGEINDDLSELATKLNEILDIIRKDV